MQCKCSGVGQGAINLELSPKSCRDRCREWTVDELVKVVKRQGEIEAVSLGKNTWVHVLPMDCNGKERTFTSWMREKGGKWCHFDSPDPTLLRRHRVWRFFKASIWICHGVAGSRISEQQYAVEDRLLLACIGSYLGSREPMEILLIFFGFVGELQRRATSSIDNEGKSLGRDHCSSSKCNKIHHHF